MKKFVTLHMEKIFWGIIGCGDVTELKSGPAFNKVSNSRLVGVMRRDARKAEDYALRHGVPKWYSDADHLIHDQNVNVIYVATPPKFHAEYAIKAMQAGKPVYVEKPMAASYSDCLTMNKVSAQTGVPLFVAYSRRSLPYFNKIKNILLAQSIGQILAINVKLYTPIRSSDIDPEALPWRVKPELSGGGYFYDMACHTLDILDYLFGPITEVSGVFANRAGLYAAEDTVTASFKFQDDIPASGLWCFVSHESSKADVVEILGTKGRIIFSTFDFSPIVLETSEGKEEFLPPNPQHIQQFMIEEVVKELRGEGKSPSDGISGARTNHVMDIILDKLQHNQES
jgi:predicted dehydrogenase